MTAFLWVAGALLIYLAIVLIAIADHAHCEAEHEAELKRKGML